jgi:esterase/lipase superfamily enzyme
MPSDGRPSGFRWYKKFIRTDAEQPSGTARMLLSFLRANQWVLFEWNNAPETGQLFACMKKEVMPKLESAEPELKVAQALGLEGSSASQLTNSRTDVPLLLPEGRHRPEEPWAARKILVDQAGTPVAIGEPQDFVTHNIRRPLSIDGASRAEYAPKYAEIKPPPSDEPPQPKDYRVVRIFYATDRARKGNGYSNRREGNDLLHLGVCDVTIPTDHRMGSLESPRWWKLEFSWNPKQHVVLQNISELPEPAFFDRMRAELSRAEERSVLVFIHGYCVSFEDGARRTAQLSYDLGFKGAPILYSWPSAASIEAYPADEETINWTKPHLANFLTDVVCKTQPTSVHIVAHSMGNRALARMLETFPPRNGSSIFNEIVLAAPDIDTGEFLHLAQSIQSTAKRFTLYASSNDKAIQASQLYHKYARAGDSGNDIVVVSGMDTIDASSVDTSFMGHSYYGDERTVISDLYYLLGGKPPDQRHGLEPKKCSKGSYWAFRS